MTEDQAKLLHSHAEECHSINRKIRRLGEWLEQVRSVPTASYHLEGLNDVAGNVLRQMIVLAAIPLVQDEIETLQRRVDDMPLLPEGVE